MWRVDCRWRGEDIPGAVQRVPGPRRLGVDHKCRTIKRDGQGRFQKKRMPLPKKSEGRGKTQASERQNEEGTATAAAGRARAHRAEGVRTEEARLQSVFLSAVESYVTQMMY